MSITAHCLVKNEEVFIRRVLESAVNFVDKIIVFDTGSTDKTPSIISRFSSDYPGKVEFEERGPADKVRHTELRQEMIERTKTDWFMVLDGDEVWPEKTLKEALDAIKNRPEVECVVVPFHLCFGDVYHEYHRKGKIKFLGRTGFQYPRFIKIVRGVNWKGDYNNDLLCDKQGRPFLNEDSTIFLINKFWHCTHLRRSSKDDSDYSSGDIRAKKRRETYFLIGKKIKDPVPEVLRGQSRLSWLDSLFNFFKLLKSILI